MELSVLDLIRLAGIAIELILLVIVICLLIDAIRNKH